MCSFILLIALFTVLGSGSDISKLPVGVAEQSYDENIGKGYNIDMDGPLGKTNWPYYGRPTNCTCSGGCLTGGCECPNGQHLFVQYYPVACYAICAELCNDASDCPWAPAGAHVGIKCVLGRCLLDCTPQLGYNCVNEDYSVCMEYQMGPAKGIMCQWTF
ncbi:hypothetical protein Pmar_PMAR010458 [Perkinsus marinus ATCC 50983]|uniref:Uncharacterized protein n=1 Tax=Perkinsus marinus (strain ATCC 50983 / TXsc) TaxID=423536 RepID=C5LEC4_PERM5|nr:hypothetical protein Pmar_PMAR010458 [Perkinsus marinus ATCC 50983]EER04906.1 hypothetical protein Pmar_PMAR010458 [Perkinsus marinus ATCC 50983]|eukprot:XP_002773090.1 hypothetical protein Pmar_PMAR010458 [Perkinsus marinus ATCC 50983]